MRPRGSDVSFRARSTGSRALRSISTQPRIPQHRSWPRPLQRNWPPDHRTGDLAPALRPFLAAKLSHMAFLSTAFVVFFVVVLLGLRTAPSRDLRRWLLLIASGYFYATWRPAYLLVLAAPIVIDYFCAIRIEESDHPAVQRRWLVRSEPAGQSGPRVRSVRCANPEGSCW